MANGSDRLFLGYTGMETDLIFNRGLELPGFASFPLLETAEGRALLTGYCRDVIEVARAAGACAVLETPTWMANRDRAARLGYDDVRLAQANRAAVALLAEARRSFGDLPTLVSGNIGPRSDAYAPGAGMTAEAAERYHAAQIAALDLPDLDLVSAYTMADPQEAIGMVRAARARDVPIAVAFTVETDGRLPGGGVLAEAIRTVDAATEAHAAFFLINCAHPDHVASVLDDAVDTGRLRGLVANASRRSHAELDEAPELDAGDPLELGRSLADLRRRHPCLRLLGGCCGTDMRHLRAIAEAGAG